MSEPERSHPTDGRAPSPDVGLEVLHPLLGGDRSLVGNASLEASPIWRAACGRRAAIRWPGHLSAFDVYSGEDRLQLSDFSTSGLGLVSTNDGAPPTVGHRLDLDLRRDDVSFAGLCLQITSSVESSAGRRLGGRLVRSFMMRPRPAQPFAPAVEPLAVADEFLSALVVERIGALRTRGRLVAEGIAKVGVRLSTGELPGSLRLLADGASASALHEGTASVETSLFGALFTLRAPLRRIAEEWVLAAPIEVFSVMRRGSERATVGRGRASIEWRHPLDPSRKLAAEVTDISPGGLAIEPPDEPIWLLPPPGVPVELKVGDESFLVHVEARRSGATYGDRVGLSVPADHPDDRMVLARAYQSTRWPSLTLRAHADVSAVHELMQASGYTSLRSGASPAEGWHAPPGDERLSLDLVYHGDKGLPRGHVSSLRAYRSTWIYHQLATLQPGRARAAYALYLQIAEWVLSLSGGTGYAIAYFNQSKRWHRTMFGDFVRWTGSPSMSAIASLDRLEPCSGPAVAEPVDASVELRPARAGDRAFITRLARGSLPALTADALDLHEHTVTTASLCPEHAAVGLPRSRKGLIAEVNGETVGVALCESGSPCLSLFNILNMAFVFFNPALDVDARASVQAALLAAVRDFYARRGIGNPIIVVPTGMVVSPEKAGLSVVESMGLWAVSGEGLKQWRNYIHVQLGFRAAVEGGIDARPEGLPPLIRKCS